MYGRGRPEGGLESLHCAGAEREVGPLEFASMAATLSPHAADQEPTAKRSDRRLVRRLVVYVRPYKRLVAGALVLLMTEGLLQLVGPILTQRVIDVALPRHDGRMAV